MAARSSSGAVSRRAVLGAASAAARRLRHAVRAPQGGFETPPALVDRGHPRAPRTQRDLSGNPRRTGSALPGGDRRLPARRGVRSGRRHRGRAVRAAPSQSPHRRQPRLPLRAPGLRRQRRTGGAATRRRPADARQDRRLPRRRGSITHRPGWRARRSIPPPNPEPPARPRLARPPAFQPIPPERRTIPLPKKPNHQHARVSQDPPPPNRSRARRTIPLPPIPLPNPEPPARPRLARPPVLQPIPNRRTPNHSSAPHSSAESSSPPNAEPFLCPSFLCRIPEPAERRTIPPPPIPLPNPEPPARPRLAGPLAHNPIHRTKPGRCSLHPPALSPS